MTLRSACLRTAIVTATLLCAGTSAAQAPSATPAAAPKPVSDADKEQARTFGREGITLYEDGKLEEAIVQFRKANALNPTPQGALYLARCYEKLGRLMRARDLYTDIVFKVPPPTATQNMRDAHAAAQTELDTLRPRIPELTVVLTGNPPATAEVTIDGTVVPAADLTGRNLDPGAHTLRLVSRGKVLTERTVTLSEGQRARIELSVPAATLHVLSSPELYETPSTSRPAAPPPLVPIEPGSDQTSPSTGRRVLPFVALGAGVVGLGVGIGTGVAALEKADEIKQKCGPTTRPCSKYLEPTWRDANTFGTASTAGFIAGGIGVGVGALLLLLLRNPSRAPSASNLKMNVGLGSLEVEGTF